MPPLWRALGPIRVACQWNRSSLTGPALQLDGGSFAVLELLLDAPVPSSAVRGRGLGVGAPGGWGEAGREKA